MAMVILMIMENINVTVMRNTIKSIMLFAAAAMTFASCQKEIASPQPLSKVLTMHADVETTKTYLDEDNQVLWGTGESVHLYVGAGETQKFVNSKPTDVYNGKTSASFSFDLGNIETSDEYCLGGVYPASVVVADNNTDSSQFKVQLPATQNSVNGNYDPSAYIMVLKPDVVDELPTEYTASFRRATALNKITLTNVAEDITSVEITVPEGKYLAGRRYFNLTTGESGDIYESGSETNVVKVNGDFKAGSIDVWFSSWGVELTEGETLTIKMSSEAKTYTRTITAKSSGVKFVEGKLNKLTVNMAAGYVEEETISNISGQYLIAAMPGNWMLMSGTNTNSIYSSVESKVTSVLEAVTCSDFYNMQDVEECVWTVAKMEGGYSLQNNVTKKYVTLTSNSNNAHTSADPVALEITVDATKATTVVHKQYNSRNLQYNSSSPRFAFYGGTQKDIYFIPWVEDTKPRISVSSNSIEVGADVTEVSFDYELKNTTGTVTATVAENPTMTNVEATVDGNTISVTFDANEDAEEKSSTIVLSIDGADDVNVTITQAAAASGDENTGTVVLSEEFDNSTNSDSSTAIGTSKFSNFSGATSKAYTSRYGGVKLGSSNAVGYITSKSLDLSSKFTVQIDACKYGSDTGNILVTVGNVSKTITNSELGAAGSFKTFTLTFEAATATSTVKIATSSKRAYIDNVVITRY